MEEPPYWWNQKVAEVHVEPNTIVVNTRVCGCGRAFVISTEEQSSLPTLRFKGSGEFPHS